MKLIVESTPPKQDAVLPHSYSAWGKRVKSLMMSLFPSIFGNETTDPATVGTHTLRKTTYLFAIWGLLRRTGLSNDADALSMNVLAADILRCARHKGVGQTAPYVKDACSLYDSVQESRFRASNEVGKWRSIIIIQEQLARSNEEQFQAYQQRTLSLQVDWWAIKDLPYMPSGGISDLYDVACSKAMEEQPAERLVTILDGALSTSAEKEEAKELLAQIIREAQHNGTGIARQASQGQMVGSPPANLSPNAKRAADNTNTTTTNGDDVTTTTTATKRSAKKPKRGDVSMHNEKACCDKEEADYRKFPTPEGAKKIWESWSSFLTTADNAGGQSKLCETARKYYRNRRDNQQGMEGCIQSCFGGDINAFFSSKPMFPSYRSKKTRLYTRQTALASPKTMEKI